MLQHMAVRVCALAAVVVTQARLVAGWRLGTSLEVVDGQEIRNHYNKIELDSNRLSNPCRSEYGEATGWRQLPYLYSMDVCFSIDSESTCDTLKLQVDTGSSDVWAITDECQKVSLSGSAASESCWPVQAWDTEQSCCASDFCNRLTPGFYTDVEIDISHSSGGKKCYDNSCLLDSYAIGCTYGETASAFVNITNNRSTNQQRRVGIINYLADLQESATVGIAGMSFSPLASFTKPVLIDDYDYFILALQAPGETSVMYLNAGLNDVNVTSKSGTLMPFYATNLVPYGGSFQYWLAAMPEMVVGGVNLCEGQSCAAVMDSGTSLWTVPSGLWEDFLKAILTSSGCSGDLTSPALGLVTCPDTTYEDFPDIRFWFSSDAASGKGVYQNFTSEQYMTCGKPSETLGSCEEGVSTCVLLAEKLDAIAASEEVKNVFVLGDTFLVGRAVVFDVENLQVHLACLEDEGCESEVALDWLQRLWRSWSAIIVVVAIGAVIIIALLIVLARTAGCCQRSRRRPRVPPGTRFVATPTVANIQDTDDPDMEYHSLN